jgi:hypothetical protein
MRPVDAETSSPVLPRSGVRLGVETPLLPTILPSPPLLSHTRTDSRQALRRCRAPPFLFDLRGACACRRHLLLLARAARAPVACAPADTRARRRFAARSPRRSGGPAPNPGRVRARRPGELHGWVRPGPAFSVSREPHRLAAGGPPARPRRPPAPAADPGPGRCAGRQRCRPCHGRLCDRSSAAACGVRAAAPASERSRHGCRAGHAMAGQPTAVLTAGKPWHGRHLGLRAMGFAAAPRARAPIRITTTAPRRIHRRTAPDVKCSSTHPNPTPPGHGRQRRPRWRRGLRARAVSCGRPRLSMRCRTRVGEGGTSSGVCSFDEENARAGGGS